MGAQSNQKQKPKAREIAGDQLAIGFWFCSWLAKKHALKSDRKFQLPPQYYR